LLHPLQPLLSFSVVMPDFYSPEEVQQILNLAIARQMTSEQLSRQQLLEIADEMGLSPAELDVAERDWRLMQGDAAQRQEFDQLRKDRFKRRFTRYVIVNGFLAGIVLFGTGGASLMGVPFIALFWGMFVALDGWNTYGMRGDRYEEAFQKWRRRRMFKRSVNTLINRFLGA
jgi:hypothetical protein